MNKNEFLSALRERLAGVPAEDIERSVEYYSEAIDDRVEAGMSEAEAVEKLGSVEEAARSVLDNLPPARHSAQRTQREDGEDIARIMDAFHSIRIEDNQSDVRFEPAKSNECTIEFSKGDMQNHNIEITEDGELIIERTERAKSAFRRLFDFSSQRAKIVVRMPACGYEALSVSSSGGDVSVPAGFAFLRAKLTSSSGDLLWKAHAEDELRLHTVSGDIEVAGKGPAPIEAESSSGDIKLSGSETAGTVSAVSKSGDVELSGIFCGALHLKSLSGDLRLQEASCKALNASSTSGDAKLESIRAEGDLHCESVSGDVRLVRCDGGTVYLKSVSGSISASLLSGKRFETSSVSGLIRVPESSGGGLCTAKTVSGSISITIG